MSVLPRSCPHYPPCSGNSMQNFEIISLKAKIIKLDEKLSNIEELLFQLQDYNFRFNDITKTNISDCLRGIWNLDPKVIILLNKLVHEGARIRKERELNNCVCFDNEGNPLNECNECPR